jgi:hypothetical protein
MTLRLSTAPTQPTLTGEIRPEGPVHVIEEIL